jgi:hypothetical protein
METKFLLPPYCFNSFSSMYTLFDHPEDPENSISIVTLKTNEIMDEASPEKVWATLKFKKDAGKLPISEFYAPEEGRYFGLRGSQEMILGQSRNQHMYIVEGLKRRGYVVVGEKDLKTEKMENIKEIFDPEKYDYLWKEGDKESISHVNDANFIPDLEVEALNSNSTEYNDLWRKHD